MALFPFLGSRSPSEEATENNPFLVSLGASDFVTYSNINFWRKIIMRTFNRTNYTDEDNKITMAMIGSFDSSESEKGVITSIVEGMCGQVQSVGLKYDKPTGVVNKMTYDEIKKYVAAKVKPANQIVLDFSNFNLSKVSKMYFYLIHYVNQIKSTQWGIAGSLIIKLNGMRDKAKSGYYDVTKDINLIVEAIKASRAGALDGGDSIGGVDSLHVDVINSATETVYKDMAASLDLPMSLVSMIATTGASVIGDADANQEADALESYYWSVMFPVMNKLFGVKSTYRYEKWRALESKARAANMISVLDVLTPEAKARMVADIFEIDDSDTTTNTTEEITPPGETNEIQNRT